MQVFTPFIVKNKNRLLRITALFMCVICTVMVLSQVVFARNTYIITDGNQVRVHSTYTTDPGRILNEAGVELSEDDIYTTDGDEKITVQRSQLITVNYCGEKIQIRSYGETVGALLERMGITLKADQILLHDAADVTYNGMEITINEEKTLGRYTFEEIPYETIYCYNPRLPADYREIVKSGVAGTMYCVAEAQLVNSQEVSCTTLREYVFEEPVSEIVVVGTGEKPNSHKNTPAVGDGVLVTADGQILYFDKVIQSEATAYTMTDEGCDETTATGTRARVGAIAVVPRVIPYFTKMFIVSNDGKYVYGFARAEDCGGAIKNNRIDLYYDTNAQCIQFGRRDCTVYILTEEE